MAVNDTAVKDVGGGCVPQGGGCRVYGEGWRFMSYVGWMMDGTVPADSVDADRAVGRRAWHFSADTAPYKFVGGTLTSAPMDCFKECSSFDFEYSSNIQLRL